MLVANHAVDVNLGKLSKKSVKSMLYKWAQDSTGTLIYGPGLEQATPNQQTRT